MLPVTCPAHLPARLPHRPSLHAFRSVHVNRPKVAHAAAAEVALPPALEKLVKIFGMVPDSKLKYQQLLQYAKKLPPLPADLHTEEHKVRGCVSQVWVVPTLKGDGTVYWAADSDSALTKGLAALLVQGLSGSSPEQIARLDPTWVAELSPQLSLTPSRTNGFLNMFRTMQSKSLALLVSQGRTASAPMQPQPSPSDPQAQPLTSQTDYPVTSTASPSSSSPGPTSISAAQGSGRPSASSSSARGSSIPLGATAAGSSLRSHCIPSLPVRAGHGLGVSGRRASAAASAAPSSSAAGIGGPVQQSMRAKIQDALNPSQLVIEDESSQHAGHAGMAGRADGSGESHFKIHVTSEAFQGLNTIKRHRLVYQALKEEMAGQVHAMSLVCKTPGEAA